MANPALQVKLPKLSREYRRDTLSNEESDQLLGTVGAVKDLAGLRDYLLVSLAVRVGVREIKMHRADVGDYSRGGQNRVSLSAAQRTDGKRSIGSPGGRAGRCDGSLSSALGEEDADRAALFLRAARSEGKAAQCTGSSGHSHLLL